MAPRKLPDLPPKPATGFQIVIGPREALARYGSLPWAEVLAAAQAGRDGLRVARFGEPDDGAARDEFILRELQSAGSRFDGHASLMRQNW